MNDKIRELEELRRRSINVEEAADKAQQAHREEVTRLKQQLEVERK